MELLDKSPCENVFSSRDVRVLVLIDGAKVQAVKCEHRDHPRLGDVKIEKVFYQEAWYNPDEFHNLPENLQEENLYRQLIQFL